jgi:two-component system, chemotaxis family, chemotaxis protein CheY
MSEPPTTEPTEIPPGLSLLVVDDSAMMRSVIKRAAALTGLPIGRIYEAADGLQALELLKQHHVDALFTDLNMPGMSGIELLQEIVGHERWRHMVRVIISTDGSDARRDEAAALEVHLYVKKPFRPEEIRDVLSTVTASR